MCKAINLNEGTDKEIKDLDGKIVSPADVMHNGVDGACYYVGSKEFSYNQKEKRLTHRFNGQTSSGV